MTNPKILILTSNYGNGHLQVARSLKQQFSERNVNEVIVKDLYYETNPTVNEWTKKIYLKSFTSSGRHFYRLFYYGSKQISKNKNVKFFSYGYSKLKKIIEEEKPELIINTFPSFAVPVYRKKTKTIIPTYNVLTDYCLHHSWIHPHIDKYYVATETVKEELMYAGVNYDRIVATGIPVHTDFSKDYLKSTLYKKHELNRNKKIALIVAGAFGVSKEVKYLCERLKDDHQLQLVIVCGNNEQLYRELAQKYNNEGHIHVRGFVTEMAELLKLATCVITKPGGIILSEAVSMNTPIILLKATPGQESENALFFQKQGAAISAENLDQLTSETRRLISSETQLVEMKKALKRIYLPNAADSISNDILNDYYYRSFNQKLMKL